MNRKISITVLTLAFAVGLTLTGCGKKTDTGAGTTSPSPATGGGTTGGGTASPAPAAGGTVDAQAVYKANCVSCHGDNLEGKLGPNTNLTKEGTKKNKDQITAQIKNGGNGMPPFGTKLKDNEIAALADWLAAKK